MPLVLTIIHVSAFQVSLNKTRLGQVCLGLALQFLFQALNHLSKPSQVYMDGLRWTDKAYLYGEVANNSVLRNLAMAIGLNVGQACRDQIDYAKGRRKLTSLNFIIIVISRSGLYKNIVCFIVIIMYSKQPMSQNVVAQAY